MVAVLRGTIVSREKSVRLDGIRPVNLIGERGVGSEAPKPQIALIRPKHSVEEVTDLVSGSDHRDEVTADRGPDRVLGIDVIRIPKLPPRASRISASEQRHGRRKPSEAGRISPVAGSTP